MRQPTPALSLTRSPARVLTLLNLRHSLPKVFRCSTHALVRALSCKLTMRSTELETAAVREAFCLCSPCVFVNQICRASLLHSLHSFWSSGSPLLFEPRPSSLSLQCNFCKPFCRAFLPVARFAPCALASSDSDTHDINLFVGSTKTQPVGTTKQLLLPKTTPEDHRTTHEQDIDHLTTLFEQVVR